MQLGSVQLADLQREHFPWTTWLHVHVTTSLMSKDGMFILQYKVSITVTDLVVVFVLFILMLALLCYCVATDSRRIKIYIELVEQHSRPAVH